MKQKSVIKHAIELLEQQKKVLRYADSLGVLLPNERIHKSNQISSIQLLLAGLIPREQGQIVNAFTAGQIDIAKVIQASFKERAFEGTIIIPDSDTEDGEEYYKQTFEQ